MEIRTFPQGPPLLPAQTPSRQPGPLSHPLVPPQRLSRTCLPNQEGEQSWGCLRLMPQMFHITVSDPAPLGDGALLLFNHAPDPALLRWATLLLLCPSPSPPAVRTPTCGPCTARRPCWPVSCTRRPFRGHSLALLSTFSSFLTRGPCPHTSRDHPRLHGLCSRAPTPGAPRTRAPAPGWLPYFPRGGASPPSWA